MAERCVRFTEVNKAYGSQQVLRSFTATLPLGGATALMGPSGSGKTTLARLLMGLERPDAGAVEGVAGLRFACAFQEDRLCEGFTAADNVALVLPRARWQGVPAALARVGLAGRDIEKPVAQLSGGERRRVALVRAVEADGDVLVLDEAFKGLDTANRLLAYAYVLENLRGRTLLVVTHDPAEAEALEAAVVPVEKLGGEAPPSLDAPMPTM